MVCRKESSSAEKSSTGIFMAPAVHTRQSLQTPPQAGQGFRGNEPGRPNTGGSAEPPLEPRRSQKSSRVIWD
uniref:Uncharacterized protein n=1 Tax=Anguilla anguilla TaxID=7936 RepID=A0A0E9QYW9_ANGAN